MITLVVLFLLIGIGTTVYKVSMARRMAERAGMDPGEATAVTLLSEDGLGATYVASSLRPSEGDLPSTPRGRPVAERLAELEAVLDQGLITRTEYDERRAAILGSL
jgi:hypothetical protein